MDQANVDSWKSTSGGLAAILWLGTGAYLFLSDADGPGFLSLTAVAFLLIGMFGAAIILGAAIYFLQRGTAKLLSVSLGQTVFTNSGERIAKVTALILLVFDILIVVFATVYSYRSLIG